MIYLLNHWQINSLENTIENTKTNEQFKVEPRSMAVLILLIENSGEVVSREEFLSNVWEGRATVEESLTRCVSELRKVLEEDSKKPTYIKTIHKTGYKLLVEAKEQASTSSSGGVSLSAKKRLGFLAAAMLIAMVGLVFFIVTDEIDIPNSAVIRSDRSELREFLLQSNPKAPFFIRYNLANGAEYSIKTSQLLNSETGKPRELLQLIDSYEFVIWETSSAQSNPQTRAASVDALLEILRLLELHK